jgi:hypothetical protein
MRAWRKPACIPSFLLLQNLAGMQDPLEHIRRVFKAFDKQGVELSSALILFDAMKQEGKDHVFVFLWKSNRCWLHFPRGCTRCFRPGSACCEQEGCGRGV